MSEVNGYELTDRVKSSPIRYTILEKGKKPRVVALGSVDGKGLSIKRKLPRKPLIAKEATQKDLKWIKEVAKNHLLVK